MESQLEGLILPPENAGVNVSLWLGLGLLTCLLGLALWRWRKNQQTAKAIANTQLKLLQQQHHQSDNSTPVDAQKLVSILCRGLTIQHLDQYTPTNIQAWKAFQSRLNEACFSTDSKYDIKALINDAQSWLAKSNDQY